LQCAKSRDIAYSTVVFKSGVWRLWAISVYNRQSCYQSSWWEYFPSRISRDLLDYSCRLHWLEIQCQSQVASSIDWSGDE
jgi:hypothetical protein